MKLYRTTSGMVVERGGDFFAVDDISWDDAISSPDLAATLSTSERPVETPSSLLPPIGTQEVWAAGVTYLRSREARQEEVCTATGGDGDIYARVYDADRPELFFKALPHRVAGSGGTVRIRRDAKWQVPEPELAIVANMRGEIVGWTIGNDMSARDLEGENPLYLPQAKIWEGSCALGPAVVVGDLPDPDTAITLEIVRRGTRIVSASTSLAKMKRHPAELVDWLFRECEFPTGVILLTGTGIVPPDDFTLESQDVIEIGIQPAGVLVNTVE